MTDTQAQLLTCRHCGITRETYGASKRTLKYYMCQDCMGVLPMCPIFRSPCLLDECTAWYGYTVTDDYSEQQGQTLTRCQILGTLLPARKKIEE